MLYLNFRLKINKIKGNPPQCGKQEKLLAYLRNDFIHKFLPCDSISDTFTCAWMGWPIPNHNLPLVEPLPLLFLFFIY